jgi:hypothetical protein
MNLGPLKPGAIQTERKTTRIYPARNPNPMSTPYVTVKLNNSVIFGFWLLAETGRNLLLASIYRLL